MRAYDWIERDMGKLHFYDILFCLMMLCACALGASGQDNRGSAREGMLMDAVSMYNDGKYADAAGILRKLETSGDADDAVNYYLGLSEFAIGRIEDAERHLVKAVELDPSNFWYRYRLAAIYSVTDRKELTEAIYEELLKDFPKRSELYYDLVDLYMQQNKMDDALGMLDQIETVFGKSEATAMTRFSILGRLDRQREAYESLEKFNEEYSSPQVLAVLGDYQMSMYNDSTALKLYEEALDIVPDYAPAILGKAETYRMTRRYDKYFRILDSFVRNESIPVMGKTEYLQAVVQRSDPNFRQTFRPQLDSAITACVAAHPKDSSVTVLAGIYYYGTDRKDKAEEYFRTNMENWPESVSAAANYIEILMYAHKWDALSREGREAFRKFPEEIAFLEMASLGDYNLEEYDKVLETCRTIVALPGADSVKVLNAYTTMGDVYHLIGDSKKSYKAYDKALKINKGHVPVLNNYAYFLSMEGRKLKKAYAMSKVTVEKEPDNATYLDTFGWILYLMGNPLEAKPFFKHAMLYGGKDSAVILDHYAEVLYALKEYDLAFVYWKQAAAKNDGQIRDLDVRVRARKDAIKK